MHEPSQSQITLRAAREHYQKIFAPWIQDLEISIDQIDQGKVVMTMPYHDRLCREGGIVCGQSLMALVDTCMVYVCFISYGKFINCATVHQNTSFLRPAINSNITAVGQVVKSGKSLIFGEVLLTDDKQRSHL
jgi:uncharacterized protein (TIGR00369 family)